MLCTVWPFSYFVYFWFYFKFYMHLYWIGLPLLLEVTRFEQPQLIATDSTLLDL